MDSGVLKREIMNTIVIINDLKLEAAEEPNVVLVRTRLVKDATDVSGFLTHNSKNLHGIHLPLFLLNTKTI